MIGKSTTTLLSLTLLSTLPAQAQDTVSQWRRWEKTLVASRDFTTSGGNPYRDLVLRVKFTASTGSTFTQDAFWEGSANAPRNFRVRAALSPGSWTWQIDSCTGSTGGQSCATGVSWNPSSGTINVTASTSSGVRLYDRGQVGQLGFVLRQPGDIEWSELRYGDLTTPFFWAADTAWTAPPREIHGDTAVWASYLADRKTKGFTVVLTAPAVAWSGAGQPWPSLPAAAGFSFDTMAGCSSPAPIPNDCSKPRPAYWQAFEQMVEQANQADLLVVVVGVADPVGLGDATHPFPNPANAEDFARYLAARLAGNHVIYSPGFDTRLDLATQNGTSTASLMQTVGSALAAASPRQLVTNHLAGRSLCTDYQSFATGSSWMTFYLFQSGHATGGMGTAGQACPGPLPTETIVQTAMRRAREMPLTLSAYTGPKLPATNGEGPYDAFSYDPTNPVDNRYRVRQAGYLSSLSNSMGFSYGASKIVFWHEPNIDLGRPSAGDMNLLFSRFRNRSGLVPRPAWILNQPADPHHEQKMVLASDLSSLVLAYLPGAAIQGGLLNPYVAVVNTQALSGLSCSWTYRWFSGRDSTADVGGCATGTSRLTLSPPGCTIGGDSTCDWFLEIQRTGAALNGPFGGAGADQVEVWTEPASEVSPGGVHFSVASSALGPEPVETALAEEAGAFPSAPRVARLGSGYVAAWQTEDLDGSLLGVFAQAFDRSAAKRGAVIRLNSTTEHDQAEPALGTDSAGNLLAAWASYGQDGDRGGIVLRRFDASLSPLSEEKGVNQLTAGHQHAPQIAVGADSAFVVAWVTEQDDKNPASLSFRRFAASGEASTGEISITRGESALVLQEVEILPLGEIRVRWAEVAAEDGNIQVFEQRFDASGTPLAPPARVGSE